MLNLIYWFIFYLNMIDNFVVGPSFFFIYEEALWVKLTS
ncbi:hypothetical protein GGP81_003253 [Salinibacter ruber]|nr:hypothetical protein [Salinibacter ruber]